MRSSLSLLILSSLSSLVLGSQECSTLYASTSTSHVPTTTKTVTATTFTTARYGTTYLPSSTTIGYTVVPVSGKTTKTVPTGPSFTPIIHAPKGPPPQGTPKRAVRQRVAPSKYPKQVFCTNTVTRTSTTVLAAKTGLYTAYVTRTTATSVKSVATATAYAACKPSNIVSKFNGQPVSRFAAAGHNDLCDFAEVQNSGQQACASLEACCSYAQANSWGGFVWTNTTTVHCYVTADPWAFDTGNTDTPMYIGNGPMGTGYYGIS